MHIENIKEAYKFTMQQCQKTYTSDKVAYEHFSTIAALIYVHLLQEGVDVESIMNEVLGKDEEE
jgi:hypothetical protein